MGANGSGIAGVGQHHFVSVMTDTQTAQSGRGRRSLAVLLAGFAGTFLYESTRRSARCDRHFVNQPVHDAVGNAGIANLFVPVRNRHLTGENGGTTLVTVIADLEEIPAFLSFSGAVAKVIQYKHVDARKLHQQLADAAVGPEERRSSRKSSAILLAMREGHHGRPSALTRRLTMSFNPGWPNQ